MDFTPTTLILIILGAGLLWLGFTALFPPRSRRTRITGPVYDRVRDDYDGTPLPPMPADLYDGYPSATTDTFPDPIDPATNAAILDHLDAEAARDDAEAAAEPDPDLDELASAPNRPEDGRAER